MDLTLLDRLNIGEQSQRVKSGGGERSEDEDSYGSLGGAGFDTRRSLSGDDTSSDENDCFNDEGLDLPVEDADLAAKLSLSFGHEEDKYLTQIKDSIAQNKRGGAKSIGSAGSGSMIESPQIKTSDQYQSIPYGLIPRASYEHGKRSTDIMGVTYNARMRQFIIIDSKGVTAWKRDAVDHRVSRALHYPKYEYGLITNMIYAKKYNCYFVLGKDFSLKVYNRDFFETCSVSADLRSVLFMLFNPVRDELITGGVGGTKVWRFHQQSGKSYTELKPLANYGLSLKYELPNVGGSWVKRVELDYHLEHLYCCSDTDLHVYNLEGKLLFKFERAHMMSITGCRYSRNASVLVTSSIDCEVKVWSLMGGLVHTFRGHSRAVTNLTLHPYTSSIVITCSLDGSVRMWSLDTMDTLYSLVVSTDGVMWMGLTDDNLLFMSTTKAITLWNLNYSLQFWAMARSRVNKMTLVGCKGKTTRLMALLDDNSVRLMARSNNKNLCTVLPPPSISPLQRVLSVCYSREFNVIFMLTNPHEIWVYTTRTDPSCRIAVWEVVGMQAMTSNSGPSTGNQESFDPSSISVNKPAPSHRATENGSGNEALANCCCIAILTSTAILWTDEGPCCPIRDSYLLMGLEDGRILFMDPVIKGHKYLEFKTGKDPVLDMTHDIDHGCLITVHKVKDMMQILVWSLPDLELQHEVYAATDLRAYARVGYTLVTGHESGCVIFHPLEITNDAGLNKGRMVPLSAEVIDIHRKPEHLAPVIGVDVCHSQKIFCSCSNDGAIKIWNEDGALMTEIMLDPSLTSVCFLNNMGGLLVGFQQQIFYIDHGKVCPQLSVPDSDVDGFDKESFICEDPAVLYEGVTPNPDPITLDSYLVPFDIDFSKDFLEGRVKLEPEPVKEEESDDESQASNAPTDIYLSPVSTPRSDLSQVDLTIGSEVSKYDLLKQMKKTLALLDEKAQSRKRRKMMKQGVLRVEDVEDGIIASVEEANLDEAPGEHTGLTFSFPVFGESPGPTPESSSPSTPQVLSETEDDAESDPIVEQTPIDVKVQVLAKPEPDEISKFLEAAKSTDYTTAKKSSKPEFVPTPRKKFGLSGVSVDAESLMREKKKVPKLQVMDSPRPAAPPVAAKPAETGSDKSESPRKERASKKRMSLTSRKLPKSKKLDAGEEKMRSSSPPSSQMQALELKEQTLKVPEKKAAPTQNGHSTSNEAAAKEKLFDEKMKKKEGDEDETSKRRAEDDKKKSEDLAPRMDVPSLPTLPLDLASNSEKPQSQIDRSQTIGSATSSGFKSASAIDNKSSIDFSSISRGGTSMSMAREVTMASSVNQDGGEAGGSLMKREGTAMTADSGIVNNIDGLSMVSGASEEGQAAFRIGLISKELTDGDSQVHGTSSLQNNVVRDQVKKVAGKPEPLKETKVRECLQAPAAAETNKVDETKTKKKVAEPSKPTTKKFTKPNTKTPNNSSDAQKKLFTKEKQKVSGGKKTEMSNLASLLEVDDSNIDQNIDTPQSRTIIAETHVPPISSAADKTRIENIGGGLRVLVNQSNSSVASSSSVDTASKQPKDGSDKSNNLLTNLPDTTGKDTAAIYEKTSDCYIERLSLDTSSIRGGTPSALSVIETESVSSLNTTTLGGQAGLRLGGPISSSPIPQSLDGLPYPNSPLPTVEEVSIQSWPSSIVSESSHPSASVVATTNKLNGTEISVQNNTSTYKQSGDRKMSQFEGKESSMVNSNKSDTGSQLSSNINSKGRSSEDSVNVSLQSSTLRLPNKSKDSKTIGIDSMGNSLIEKDNVTSETSSDNARKLQKGCVEDLNKRIDIGDQSTSYSQEGMPNQSYILESQDGTRVSSKQSTHSLEIKETSIDTTLSPVSQIVIQKKTDGRRVNQEHSNNVSSGGENDHKVNSPENLLEQEEEMGMESWDSDFDNMSVSDGSCMMSSSPFGDTTEESGGGGGDGSRGGGGSSSSSKKVNLRQSLQNLGGNVSASSAATEPVLQVRIRKKPWSYYRNKEQQRSSPLPLRKDGYLQRKFSQNDALTVQRNAYLDTVKLRKKRARSAVEGKGGEVTRSQLQASQQLNATSNSSTATHCALCAAEEGGTAHGDHANNLGNEGGGINNVNTNKTEVRKATPRDPADRKVSFDFEGGVGRDGEGDRITTSMELQENMAQVSDRSGRRDSSPRTPPTTTTPPGVDADKSTSRVENWNRRNDHPHQTHPPPPTPTAAAAAAASGFESPRPHSQAALSQAFSDMSSIQPIPSPTTTTADLLNQSVTLTDFSHLQSPRGDEEYSESKNPAMPVLIRGSHNYIGQVAPIGPSWKSRERGSRIEESTNGRRPESVESGWMGSDLVSVSRMGYHGGAGGLGDSADPNTQVAGQDIGPAAAGGLVDQAKDQGADDKESESSSKKLTRPRTSLAAERSLGKPELDDAVKFFRQRPHTANVRFQTERSHSVSYSLYSSSLNRTVRDHRGSKPTRDMKPKNGKSGVVRLSKDLQEAFDSTMERYKVMARTPLASDNVHRNDDMAFTENWHERQIERHMLVRMQKELRAQSAQQRRQILEQRKLERFRQHQEQDHGPQSSKFHPYHYAHSSLNNHHPPPQRSVTVHGSRPAQTTPTPTPVSSRPHTSTGLRGDPRVGRGHHHQRSQAAKYVSNNVNNNKNLNVNPATAFAHQAMQQLEQQQQQEQQQRLLQEQESALRDRSELSQEKAFRFRMREKDVVEEVVDAEGPAASGGGKLNVDLWAIDPRNPQAVRPKSRKSIPSKCHRYVLVSKPKIKLTLPLPTPLEEELLATRFPEQGEKVYKKYEGLLYKPPRRPMYGIEYTPFNAFQTYTN